MSGTRDREEVRPNSCPNAVYILVVVIENEHIKKEFQIMLRKE